MRKNHIRLVYYFDKEKNAFVKVDYVFTDIKGILKHIKEEQERFKDLKIYFHTVNFNGYEIVVKKAKKKKWWK